MEQKESLIDLVQLSMLLEIMTGKTKPGYEEIPRLIVKRRAVAFVVVTICFVMAITFTDILVAYRTLLLLPLLAALILWLHGIRLARELLMQAESAAEEVFQDTPA